MASLANDKDGGRRILFVDAHGRRRTIRLGSVGIKAARAVLARVEALADAQQTRTQVGRETGQWVADLPDALHERLARVGLVTPRAKATEVTLGPMLDVVLGGLSVKPGTMLIYNGVKASLLNHFGADRAVVSITAGEAEEWRQTLLSAGLAMPTIHKRTRVARSLFKRAVDLELIGRNVFAKLRAGSQTNPERQHYIDRDTLEAVLAACPNAQWRIIFGLARLAGLRIPSELAGLTWGCIDFEASRMIVKSPKTSGCGKASRSVPIDPRLKALLLEAFTNAPDGATYVVSDPRHRAVAANLRTGALKILDRAGVPAWPKLFGNLRASLATDWSRALPAKACAEFLGHTAAVALQHYHQTRPEDFTIISAGGAESGARVAQKAAQHVAASDGKVSQARPQVSVVPNVARSGAEPCESLQAAGMTPRSCWDEDGNWWRFCHPLGGANTTQSQRSQRLARCHP